MLIYKDIFSDDELCSDTFPVKVVDDVILEFTGKFVVRKEGDIVIAGFNPSTEEGAEQDEGTEEAVQKGVDIVLNHQLVEMPIYQNAAVFKDWVKEYMKKLVDRLTSDGKSEDEVKQFKTKMQKWVMSLLSKERFKNLQFYQGSSDNAAEGQLAILEFRENDIPVVMLVKPGLVEEKCQAFIEELFSVSIDNSRKFLLKDNSRTVFSEMWDMNETLDVTYFFDECSQWSNITCDDNAKIQLESKIQNYRIGVPVLVTLCLLSIIANCHILMTVRYLTRSPSPTLYFTLSLTVADAWVCLAMAVSLILHSYLPHVLQIKIQNSICLGLAYEGLRMGAMITSVLHLLLLALNHYAGIARPLHYQSTVTPELAVISICIVWTIPPLIFLLFFSAVPNQGFLSKECSQVAFFAQFKFRAVVSSTMFIPLLAMLVIYVRIFMLIAQTRRRWYNTKTSSAAAARKRASNVKAAITTSLIMGTFVIGWIPSVFIFLLICRNCIFDLDTFGTVKGQNLLFYLGFFSNLAIVFKSLIDPVIYAARVKEIKLALFTMHPYFFGRIHLVAAIEKMDMTRMSIRPTGSASLGQACREVALSRARQHLTMVKNRNHPDLDQTKSGVQSIELN